VARGEQTEQRLARDLRHRIPHRHVDGADRERAFAMAAGLLVTTSGVAQTIVRIEIGAVSIEQCFGIGLLEATAQKRSRIKPPCP